MTLYLDDHESIEFEMALSQLVPTERAALNLQGKPDVWWLDCAGHEVGWECKQAGELLGSLSDVEEQLTRELEGVTWLGLAVRGHITPTLDGYCQTWKPAGGGNDRILVKNKVFRTPYTAYAEWTVRIERMGVMVRQTGDLNGLCLLLAVDYKNAQKDDSDHRTFSRLIVLKQQVSEWDQDKRRVALQFMGCVPGVGEEIALCLADHFPSVATLVNTLQAGAQDKISGLKLRGGRRTIGPAAVKRIVEALGI